jgi:hypothetical protein
MSVLMFDSASPEDIPSGASCAAAYVNGYTWPAAQVRRFSRVIKVSVLPEAYWARVARCIDVETGAASPADAAAFIRERESLGLRDATVYCNKSTLPAVQDACAGLEYRLWLADPTGVPHELDGAWAVQFAWVTGKYDQAMVYGTPDFTKPREREADGSRASRG